MPILHRGEHSACVPWWRRNCRNGHSAPTAREVRGRQPRIARLCVPRHSPAGRTMPCFSFRDLPIRRQPRRRSPTLIQPADFRGSTVFRISRATNGSCADRSGSGPSQFTVCSLRPSGCGCGSRRSVVRLFANPPRATKAPASCADRDGRPGQFHRMAISSAGESVLIKKLFHAGRERPVTVPHVARLIETA